MTAFDWRRYDGSYWGVELVAQDVDWREYRIDNPSGAVTCRSMLMRYELAMLYALARDHFGGRGAIVDAGALTGVTTNSLVKGLLTNPALPRRPKAMIFAFDLFDYIPHQNTLALIENRNGSIFDCFLTVNKDYLDIISVCPGDLRMHPWNSGPIEICLIDIAKTWDLNTFVVDNWFPHLVEGAHVVQQDYCALNCYWLPITMMALKEHFEFVDYAMGGSNVFRCINPVPPGMGEYIRQLPFATQEALLDEAIAAAPKPVAPLIQSSKAAFYIVHDKRERAMETLDQVSTEQLSEDWATDFSAVAKGFRDLGRHYASLTDDALAGAGLYGPGATNRDREASRPAPVPAFRPSPPTKPLYAPAMEVKDPSECLFYHTVDVPGFGEFRGYWDLRGHEAEYLGLADPRRTLDGKSVLEIGPASGALTFWLEKQGADVVGLEAPADASVEYMWNVGAVDQAALKARVEDSRRGLVALHKSWWLTHRLMNSRARVHYGNAYDIPDALGQFDIVTLSCVMLHNKSPHLILESAARVAREMVIVTEVMPPDELAGRDDTMIFTRNDTSLYDGWFQFPPGLMQRMLRSMGFGDSVITTHSQLMGEQHQRLYTIVARRSSGS